MNFPAPVSIESIASLINATIVGNNRGDAKGINELNRVSAGDLAFVDHPKYYEKSLNSNATYIKS